MTEFTLLEKKILNGEQPDSPLILTRYLEIADEQATQLSRVHRIQTHSRTLDTLLEAICDNCLPKQWRCHCLNHCYRPLFAIQHLITNDAERDYLREQYQKLRTLSHYFFN